MGRDRMMGEQAGVTGKLKSKLGKKLFYVLSLTGITAIGGWIMKKCKPKWYKAIVEKLPNFWPFSYLKDGKNKDNKKKKDGKKDKSGDEKGSSSSDPASDSATGGADRSRSAPSPRGGGGSQLSYDEALAVAKRDREEFWKLVDAKKISNETA